MSKLIVIHTSISKIYMATVALGTPMYGYRLLEFRIQTKLKLTLEQQGKLYIQIYMRIYIYIYIYIYIDTMISTM